MTPTTGEWGTNLTIDGQNFGISPDDKGGVVSFAGVGADGFVIDTWHDNEIRGRVAFPATGQVSVQTIDGSTVAGTFATDITWTPSDPFNVTQFAAELVLSTGDAIALYDHYDNIAQPTLAVFSGAGALPIDGVAGTGDARLIEGDDHGAEVIATQTDGTVVDITVQNNTLATAVTGLTGDIVAVARDATGKYAWLDTATGLVRARPGSPMWTVDRGPFTESFSPLDGAVAADGTLIIVVAEPDTGDNAFLSLQALGPSDTTLGALDRSNPTSAAGPIATAHLTLADDGIHALVSGTGPNGAAIAPRLRTAASTWSDAPTMTGLAGYAFTGTTLAAVVNDAPDKTTSFVPDVTMPAGAQVIPVWPMQTEGFVFDAGGKPHPLLTTGALAYSVSPP